MRLPPTLTVWPWEVPALRYLLGNRQAGLKTRRGLFPFWALEEWGLQYRHLCLHRHHCCHLVALFHLPHHCLRLPLLTSSARNYWLSSTTDNSMNYKTLQYQWPLQRMCKLPAVFERRLATRLDGPSAWAALPPTRRRVPKYSKYQ